MNTISAPTVDITTLATQMHNIRIGLPGAAGTAPSASPKDAAVGDEASEKEAATTSAVTIALSPQALEAMAAEAANAGGRENSRGEDVGRIVADQALAKAAAMEKQLTWMKAQVQKYEETGEIWMGDMNGELKPMARPHDFAEHGGPAAYMEQVRKSLAGFAQNIEKQYRTAEEWLARRQEG
jgi:Rad3-related DNA helicase